MTKELRDEASKLGLGKSGFGSKKTGAALEGYVAAIEVGYNSDLSLTLLISLQLFDLFCTSLNGTYQPERDSEKPVIQCHMLHISYTPPDDSVNPLWNQDQDLDDVTWHTLPDELHKVCIDKRQLLLSLIHV